jgi:hypothetical protein
MAPIPRAQNKKSGGKVHVQGKEAPAEQKKRKEEPLLRNPPAEFGVAHGGKTIVVRDENGQIVSVTHVARDTPYGVGVKPAPGHIVKEIEQTEDLRDALKPEKVPEAKPGKKKHD